MKVRTISVALALTLVCATIARAVPSQSWQRSAEIAFKATEDGDWDTAIINLRRAIAGNPNECLDAYYQQFIDAAQEAKALIREGGRRQDAYQRYHTLTSEIVEDCQG
jgi:hypothetical protein